jgi:Ca-activated chloride channel homolog
VRLTTYLDFGLVALEQDDELTLMLELTAPPAATRPARPPASVVVVLDRSKSMRGTRLRTALIALDRLVGWLDERDHFGLVAFDRHAEVVVPAGPLTNTPAVRSAIAHIAAGTGSDLAGGYAQGVAEAETMYIDTGSTVLLISDGHADLGSRGASKLEQHAATARLRGVTTSTLALGPEADTALLAAIAHGGVGTTLSATGPEAAAALLAGEVSGLLQPVARSVQLELRPVREMSSVTVLGDMPVTRTDAGLLVELGNLYDEERRRLIVSLAVNGIYQPGEVKVADVALQYVALPSLVPQALTLPLNVTVVPAGSAAQRVPSPIVANEALFQGVQQATASVARAHAAGDLSPTARALSTSASELECILAAAPTDLRDELAQAVAWLDENGVRGLMPNLRPSLHRSRAPRR